MRKWEVKFKDSDEVWPVLADRRYEAIMKAAVFAGISGWDTRDILDNVPPGGAKVADPKKRGRPRSSGIWDEKQWEKKNL